VVLQKMQAMRDNCYMHTAVRNAGGDSETTCVVWFATTGCSRTPESYWLYT